VIDIGNRNADEVWNVIDQVQDQMRAHIAANPNSFNYDLFYNSNTFVNTLLSVVGVNIFEPINGVNGPSLLDQVTLPFGNNGNVIFPGANRNALTNPDAGLDIFNLSLVGNNGVDYIFTGLGNDNIDGLGGDDILSGGNGNDVVFGGLGNDILIGAGGNDSLNGGVVSGDGGFDIADYSRLDKIIVNFGVLLGAEVDKFDLIIAPVQTPVFPVFMPEFGTQLVQIGVDNIFDIDLVIGTAGNDSFNFLNAYVGMEIVGGEGFDTVDYSSMGGSITAQLNGNSVSVTRSGATDTLTEIEAINGTAQADAFFVNAFADGVQVTINGNSPLGPFQAPIQNGTAARLEGSSGKDGVQAALAAGSNNSLFATGNDSIVISQALLDAGAQTTFLSPSGQGIIWLETNGVTQTITYSGVLDEPNQTEFFAGLTDGATVGLTETGNVMLDFSGSTEAIDSDVLNAIPLFNLVDEFVGSNLGDDIDLALTGLTDFFGGDAGDTVTGTDDGNMISGGGGDDVLSGAVGDDMLIGGAGGDTLDGGVGIDTAAYSDADAGVRVGLNGQITATGDAVGDSFIDVENLTGSAFNDVLYGSGDINVLSGGDGTDQIRGADGADTLLGGAGDDYLWGDAGADVINGGDGNDWAYYSTSSEGVNVHLINNVGTGGDAEGDTWISIERVNGSSFRDVIVGSNEVNYLRGANGDDVLSGQNGDDFLQGDAGADSLIGGAGRDWAYYGSSTVIRCTAMATVTLFAEETGTTCCLAAGPMTFYAVISEMTY